MAIDSQSGSGERSNGTPRLLRSSQNVQGKSRWPVGIIFLAAALLLEAASATWMQVNVMPAETNFGGDLLVVQPSVTLWTEVGKLDAFGVAQPSGIAYDSVVYPVEVSAMLYDAGGADATSEWTGATTITASCGVAQFTDLVVNRIGAYKIGFTATYLGPNPTRNETGTFSVVHGQAYMLSIVTQPGGIRSQRPFQVQPVLHVLDRGGNRITSGPGATTNITATGIGIQLFNLGTQVIASGGVAIFEGIPCEGCSGSDLTGLAFMGRASGATIIFTSPGLLSVTSRSMDSSEWPPATLSVVADVIQSSAGLPLNVQPVIALIDENGLLVSWLDSPVNVRVEIRERENIPDTLQGTKELPIVDGRASFTDLGINFMAASYTLDFRVVTLYQGINAISSQTFDITAGEPHHLQVVKSFGRPSTNGSDPGLASPGEPMAKQPIIFVADSKNNWVQSANVSITATLLRAGAPFFDSAFELAVRTVSTCAPPLTPASGECGRAQFVGLRVDSVGSGYTMRFSSPSLPSYTSAMAFDVLTGPAYELNISSPPLGFLSGVPFRQQPTITLMDRGGNPVTSGLLYTVVPTLLDASDPSNLTPVLASVNRLVAVSPSSTSSQSSAAYPQLPLTGGSLTYTDLGIIQTQPNLLIRFTASPTLPVPFVDSAKMTVASNPVRLKVDRQPFGARPGSPFDVMPRVLVTDVFDTLSGWSIGGVPLAITTSICTFTEKRFNISNFDCLPASDPPVAGIDFCFPPPIDPRSTYLKGNRSEPAVEGIATFTTLRVDKQGLYTIRFSVGGLVTADSAPFSVTLGPRAKLSVSQDVLAEHRSPGYPLEQQPTVLVQDMGGNTIVDDFGTSVTAVLEPPAGVEGASLKLPPGIFPVSLSIGGITYFQGLKVDKSGQGFRIAFTSPGLLTGKTRPFAVLDGPPAALDVLTRPYGCRAIAEAQPGTGTRCTVQPSLGVQDRGGNNVGTVNAVINASIFDANGLRLDVGRSMSVNMTAGLATFTDFRVDTPGLGLRLVFQAAGYDPAIIEGFSVSTDPASLDVDWQPPVIEPGYDMQIQPRLLVRDSAGAVAEHDSTTKISVIVTSAVPPGTPDAVSQVSTTQQQIEKALEVRSSSSPPPLGGFKSVTAQGGFNTFTNLRVDDRGVCYRLIFQSPGLNSAISRPFDIFLGFQKKIMVTREPSGVIPGQHFLVQPAIAVTDLGGNLLTTDSESMITASILNQPLQVLRGGTAKVVTVSEGTAEYSLLSIEKSSGCYQLAFTSVGRLTAYSKPFSVDPLPPSSLSFVTFPGGAAPGLRLTTQPAVKAVDKFGNFFSNVTGSVSVELYYMGVPADCSGGPMRRCIHPTSTTNVAFLRSGQDRGIARFSNLRIDRASGAAGNYSLRFTSPGMEPLISPADIMVIPGATAVSLGMLVEPGLLIPGQPFGRPATVGVVDAGGNVLVDAFPTPIDVILIATDDSSSMTGTTTIITDFGEATFADIKVNSTGKGFALQFESLSTGLGVVLSERFDVSGPPHSILILQQPQGTVAGNALSIQPSLKVVDSQGRLVTALWGSSYSLAMNITVSLQGNSGVVLQGSTTAPYKDGSATFTDLRIDVSTNTSLQGYVLVFSHQSLTKLSDPFHITNAPGQRLVVLSQPSGASPGLPLTGQPSIEVQDPFGNRVVDIPKNVSVSLLQASLPSDAPLAGNKVVVTANGVASFTDLTLAVSGSDYALTFESEGLLPVTSSLFNVPIGHPSYLEFVAPPSIYYLDEPVSPQPAIRLRDLGNNLVPVTEGSINISLVYEPTWNCPSCQGPAPGLNISQPWCLPDELVLNASIYCQRVLAYNGTRGTFYVPANDLNVTWWVDGLMNATVGTSIYYDMRVTTYNGNVSFSCVANSSLFQDRLNMSEYDIRQQTNNLTMTLTNLRMYIGEENMTLINARSTGAVTLTGGSCTKHTLVKPIIDGVATFVGVKITEAASSLRLVVTHVQLGLSIRTDVFDVSGPAVMLNLSTAPSLAAQGGVPLNAQPFVVLTDSAGRRVTNHSSTQIKATLVTTTSLPSCTALSQFRCTPTPQAVLLGIMTSSCVRNLSLCPALIGTDLLTADKGQAPFQGISISTCNTQLVQSEICVFGEYKILFTAVSSSGAVIAPVFSDPVTVSIGPPHTLVINNGPVGGTLAGEPMPAMPDVLILDQGGNRVLDTDISVTAVLVDQAGATLLPSSVGGHPTEAATKGGVTFTDLRITYAGNGLSMLFSAPGVSPVYWTGTFDILQGAGTFLSIATHPDGGLGGVTLQQVPVVRVTDSLDNTLTSGPGSNTTVTASILQASNPWGASITKGAESVAIAGVATFTELAIDSYGFCYVLQFSAPGFSSVTSFPFKVSVGLPQIMSVVTQPGMVRPGYTFDSLPKIALTDLGSNIIDLESLNDRIEVSLVPGNVTGTPVLYGNTMLRAVRGVASFTDLMIKLKGLNYRLNFHRVAGGMADVLSLPFDVFTGEAQGLRIRTDPAGASPGNFLVQQPVVEIVDAGDNFVDSGNHLITANLYQDGLPSSLPVTGPLCDAFICSAQCGRGVLCADPRTACPTCVRVNSSVGYDTSRMVWTKNGVATFTELSVEAGGTGYSLRFTSSVLLWVQGAATFDVVPGVAQRLRISVEARGFLLSSPFQVQPEVSLIDWGSNLASTSFGSITAQLLQPSGRNAVLESVNGLVATTKNGKAAFNGLSVNLVGANYQILFTSSDCAGVKGGVCRPSYSVPFEITLQGVSLNVSVVPSGTRSQEPFDTQPVVHILDPDGRLVSSDSGVTVVTASLLSGIIDNPRNGTLRGQSKVTCCLGVCKFTDLSIDRAFSKYRISFDSPPFTTAISSAFPVLGPARLQLLLQPAGALSSFPFVSQPRVRVLPDTGVPLSAVTITQSLWNFTIAASISSGTGSNGAALTGKTTVEAVNGLAVFTDLSITGPGSAFQLLLKSSYLDDALSLPFDVDYSIRPNTCANGQCRQP